MLKNPRFYYVALLLGAIVVAIDQATKIWALNALNDGRTIDLIGPWLGLKLTFNAGASFSFGDSFTWFFTLFAAVFSIGVPIYMRRVSSPGALMTLGVVWGGAVGNLIDRLFREPGFPNGHVVDFIKYADWFIGNVADIALVGGLAAFVLVDYVLIKRGHKDVDDEEDSDEDLVESEAVEGNDE
ncbi:MAG: signal peptidase II [Actinomycetaceae bacterium]|nr:signal peptidase II [Actinomycetaceae bacterium]